jgi:hypothetical protein
MGKVRLDDETADRMLAGRVDPADAPPGFEAVGKLLEAARTGAKRPAVAAVVVRHRTDLRSIGSPTRTPQRRRSMLVTTPKLRLSVFAAVAVLAAMTGAAYATGLPAAASSTASAVLQRLRITSPAANSHTGATPAKTTRATRAAKAAVISATASDASTHAGRTDAGASRKPTTGGKGGTDASGHGKGGEISTLAHTTTATGSDKGAVISTAASGGRSHAGQHGGGASGHGSGKATGSGHSHSGGTAGHRPGS